MPDDPPDEAPILRQPKRAPQWRPILPLTTEAKCSVCGRAGCKSVTRKALAFARERRSQRQARKHAPVHQIADEKINPFARHPIKMDKELEGLYALAWSRWNPDFRGPERHL